MLSDIAFITAYLLYT